MSQHLLDGVEIRAVFQQMGGKGVAQGVRGDFCLNSGLLLIVLDDLPKALAAHALPAHIHEQGAFLRVLQHLGPHVLYVVLKRPDSRRPEQRIKPADRLTFSRSRPISSETRIPVA